MPKLSANVDFLFADVPFLQRFERARDAGFRAVECHWSWRDDVPAMADALRTTGLRLDALNANGGNYPAGDRGFAADPGRMEAFRDSVDEAIEAAAALGGPKIHILAGKRLPDLDITEQFEALVGNYAWAAERLGDAGRLGLIELLNQVDSPGYILESIDDVTELLDAVDSPDLRIQFDVYHLQRTQGELIPTLRRLADRIGHIQIADSPGRHEPGTGEINYASVLRAVDEVGYEGYVGRNSSPT